MYGGRTRQVNERNTECTVNAFAEYSCQNPKSSMLQYFVGTNNFWTL